jgi:hypothetical protein
MQNYNSIHIKGPKDIRRLMQRVLNSILRSGQEVEYAGKICNLSNTWLKSYELDKISEIEKRVEELEEGQRRNGGFK